jgi:carboxyl-terminal processing protease
VTYTQGRKKDAPSPESMKLYTENEPLLPKEFPIIVLTNEMTASCSEIVTGAMQFYQRTIVVGAKTYGKGSVQTIIPLARPAGAALRLTTALYYTPAEVTIDSAGIKPDVEVAMEEKESFKLLEQMYKSYEDDPKKVNEQNHGTVTGAAAAPELMEDVQLKRAVELLKEDPSWENLIKKYHKDVHETQVAAEKNSLDGKEDAAKPADAQKPADGSQSPGSDGQMRKIDPPVIFVPAPEKK